MRQFAYLRSIFYFAFQANPLLYASLLLTVISVGVEVAAMTVLLPLAIFASGAMPSPETVVVRALASIGVPLDGRSLLLVFLFLLVVRILTQVLGQSLTIYIGRRMILQLASRAFAVLLKSIPIVEIEKKSIGYFITLAGDESVRASNIVVFAIQLVSLMLLGVLYFGAIAAFSLIAAISVVGFFMVSSIFFLGSFRVSRRLGSRQIEQSQQAGSLFLDALNGLRSVRSFSAERYISNSYTGQMRAYVRTLALIDLVSLLSRTGPTLLLLVLGLGVVLSMGVSLSQVNLPYIVTILFLLMRFLPVIGQIMSGVLQLVADARAARDVTEIIDRLDAMEIGDSTQYIDMIERIAVNNLHFSHVAGTPVLKGLNVAFERGKSYAIIGASGSGKSTFLDVLLAFYPVQGGQILINGTPIDQIAPSILRRHILLFTQDAAIFNDTVANNLRFGCDARVAELDVACKIAAVDELIAQLPQGYDTQLTYRGGNLSGGQRQRIGIARAVLRRPDVLLLDESTSALDVETRDKIVGNLLAEFKDRIIVFVTHDVAVTKRVDCVIDMAAINVARAIDRHEVFGRID